MAHADPFDELRARIRSTADAAERLSFEATTEGPRSGPQADGGARARTADEATQEAQALVALVGLLRELLPDELRRQVADLIRQVLLLVRAVIDSYLVRLEAGEQGARPGPPPVEDIRVV